MSDSLQAATAAKNILIVDDEHAILHLLESILKASGWTCFSADNIPVAKEILAREPIDLLITDQCLPTGAGLELGALARGTHPDMAIILMTGFASLSTVLEALKIGVFDYWVKPFEDIEHILLRVSQASKSVEDRRELALRRAANPLLPIAQGAAT